MIGTSVMKDLSTEPYLQPCHTSLMELFCEIDQQLHATVLFRYALKTSENQRISDVFRGYRKRPVVWNRLSRWLFFPKNNIIDVSLGCKYSSEAYQDLLLRGKTFHFQGKVYYKFTMLLTIYILFQCSNCLLFQIRCIIKVRLP